LPQLNSTKKLLVNSLLLDFEGQTASDWQVEVYPTSFLLDTNGWIRHVAYDQLEWDDRVIVQTIEALLAEPETGITVHSDSLPATGVAATAE